jgi:predicted nucleotidyltransferase
MSQATTVDFRSIQELSDRIARAFQPRSIILFGSHAHGAATADSDVDLLIILPFTGRPADKSVEIRLTTRPSFPVDLIVHTPDQVQRRLAMGDTFIRDILQAGKVLYEADDQ